LICLLVGGLRAGRGVLRKWRPFASFGVYGGKEITGALRTWRRPLRNFYPPSITNFVSLDYDLCVPLIF